MKVHAFHAKIELIAIRRTNIDVPKSLSILFCSKNWNRRGFQRLAYKKDLIMFMESALHLNLINKRKFSA